MGDQDDPGMRTIGERAGIIGTDLIALIASQGDRFRDHALTGTSLQIIPHSIITLLINYIYHSVKETRLQIQGLHQI